MKDLVEWLLKSIVDNPEKVSVEESQNSRDKTVKATVAKEDMGKVIGKGGKIIKSLRSLARIRGIKEGKRVFLELLERP